MPAAAAVTTMATTVATVPATIGAVAMAMTSVSRISVAT